MAKTDNSNKPQETSAKTKTAKQRRALLKKLGPICCGDRTDSDAVAGCSN